MSGRGLRTELNAEKTALLVKVVDGENEVFSCELSAPDVDHLVRNLAKFRSQMADQVTPDLDPGSFISDCIADPNICTSLTKDGKLLIAYRHPGLGWLGLRLSQRPALGLVREVVDWCLSLSSPSNRPR